MAKPDQSYSVWLKRRIEYADGLTKAARAAEFARVRSAIEGFKARNLDNLGDSYFDSMLTETDKAAVWKGKAEVPRPAADVGAFD